MLTIPSLPTDSLYKFLFIGGITLFAFCMYTSSNQVEKMRYQTKRIDSLNLTIKATNQHYLKRLDSAKKVLASSVKRGQMPPVLEINRYDREHQRVVAAIRKDSLFGEQEQLNDTFIREAFKSQTIIITIGLITSGIMITFGLAFWYTEQQVHQDSIGKMQAELTKIQLETARIELRKLNETND